MKVSPEKLPPVGTAPHPRTIGWLGTAALAMGGSNQSLFIIGVLIAGQDAVPGQGTAAIVLLITGLLLAWMAAFGWTELVLMWPNRVGGIAATCAEAFRPYSPVLATLAGVCYWWGWVPTCGLTAIFSASAIHQWYLPQAPIPLLASLLVCSFTALNLCGIKAVTRFVVPIATASALLALLSGIIPLLTGHVDWRQASHYSLMVPFHGVFGKITSAMAGLYLVGFAAPAFEAAACHVGETIDPNRNVPRAMFASGAMALLYFAILPVIWLGVIGPHGLAGDLASTLPPTFAPWFGSLARALAIWFMIFNMFHGTIQPLAGAARTLSQLADDGLVPKSLGVRNRKDAPWVATACTAAASLVFLWFGDPIWMVAAANLTYLIGICLPNVAVWLLRRDAPERIRPYRAPRGMVELGLAVAAVWGIATLLGFQQFGLPTVLFGLMLAYSGAALHAWRRWQDQRAAGLKVMIWSLHGKLCGAMLLVLALDGAGYLIAISHVPQHNGALITALEDIFVAVALLSITVGLVLPGMVAHTAQEIAVAAGRLATGTLADFSKAMEALGRGDLDAAHARMDIVPVAVHSRDELGVMAASFNTMQREVAEAAAGLDAAREGLRAAHQALIENNLLLEQRIDERTQALQSAVEERERLLAGAQARADREALLNRIGLALRTSIDPDVIQASAVMELGKALEVDRCYFAYYKTATDDLIIGDDWHRPDLPSIAGNYKLSGFGATLQQLYQSLETHVIRDVRQMPLSPETIRAVEMMGLRSGIRVPVIEHGELVAVLTAAMSSQPRDWTSTEATLVEAVAVQTRAAVETARIHMREHAIADSLQRALLPPIPIDYPTLDLASHYQAALDESNIGGDFYDVFPLGKKITALIIGDVSGKGLAAAAQLATIRHMLRCVLYLGLPLDEASNQLNMLLIEHSLLTGFATLFIGIYDAQTQLLQYVSCGHEPALILRSATATVEELHPTGMALGINISEQYASQKIALSAGDALVLYTDGLSEAMTKQKQMLGVTGLSGLLQAHCVGKDAQSLVHRLINEVKGEADVHLRDDVCLLTAVIPSPQHTVDSEMPLETIPIDLSILEKWDNEPVPAASLLTQTAQVMSEPSFRHFAALSHDLVAIVREGRFEFVNAAGLQMLGAGMDDLIGRPFLEIIDPHFRALAGGRFRLLEQGQQLGLMKQQWRRLDGHSIQVEVAAAMLPGQTEAVIQLIARDITQIEAIQEENARLLYELQASAGHERSFLRDVLTSVTEGHLRLCETTRDLPVRALPHSEIISLTKTDIHRIRHKAQEAAEYLGMALERNLDLITAVGEAAMNAVAHGGGGEGQVCIRDSATIQVWIQDDGEGIAMENLPQATLERGYTTAGTLGHGFWMMLQTVDRVWLLTGPEGTTVVLEQDAAGQDVTWKNPAARWLDDKTASPEPSLG